MLLTVDIGNTNLTIGAYSGEELKFVARLATDRSRTEDQYAIELKSIFDLHGYAFDQFSGCAISSVVPELTGAVAHAAKRITGNDPVVLGPGVKTGINILADDPSQAGADLVAASVARSQLKRHRVDAAAECAHALLEGCGLAKLDMPADEADVLERGLNSLDARMQAHFDRARALAEYLAANEMVRDVRYPGLSSHPDHAVATGILEHGFGPAVEFDLIELSAGELFDALPGEFRTSSAGGATTRLSAPRGKQGSAIRLFAGTDDPLIVAATLDNALRN